MPLSARLQRGVYVALQVLAFQLAVPLAALAGARSSPRRRADRSWRQLLAGALRAPAPAPRRDRGVAAGLRHLRRRRRVGVDALRQPLHHGRHPRRSSCWAIALLARLHRRRPDGERPACAPCAPRRWSSRSPGWCSSRSTPSPRSPASTGVARTIVFSKSTRAGGRRAGDPRRSGLRTARWAPPPRPRRGSAARCRPPRAPSRPRLALVAIVWGPAQLQGMGSWALRNAAQYTDEANYTREGLLIRAATGKAFRIAVVAAGATPYFCDRPSEDHPRQERLGHRPPRAQRRLLPRARQVGLLATASASGIRTWSSSSPTPPPADLAYHHGPRLPRAAQPRCACAATRRASTPR